MFVPYHVWDFWYASCCCCCWTPFPAVSGRDPPKRGAATWHLCSSHFGFKLLCFWRRESALLLCKRIPLRHYNARAWTWPPLLWRETGLLLLLIGFSLSTAGPLFQPWAAEILERGAPQPDVKRAAIWFFSMPLPHIEAVPPSAFSVPALCACRLVRVAFFGQIPFPKHCSEWPLPSTPFMVGLAQLVKQMALNLKVEGSTPPRGMCLSYLLAFASTVVRVLLLEGKCIASLQEDPAEDSLCLACFYCATTVQGLELDLRFCDGKLDCFFCCTASPYLPLDPFLSRERARSFNKGPTATSAQTFTFFQALDPFLSRERPRSSEKGATATSAPIFTIFQALDPFLSRERPGSSTEGSFNPFLEDLGRSRLNKGSSAWKKVKVWTDVAAASFLEDLGRSWLEKGSSGR